MFLYVILYTYNWPLFVFIDAGYIQENGVLNLDRYEKYIAALVEVLGSSLLNSFWPSILTLHHCVCYLHVSNLKNKFDEETREKRQEQYRKNFAHLNVSDQDLLPKVVESYVTGVQWVLQYYYTGMPSWDWWVNGAVTVMWLTNLLFLCCNLHYCVCMCSCIFIKYLMQDLKV